MNAARITEKQRIRERDKIDLISLADLNGIPRPHATVFTAAPRFLFLLWGELWIL
jgi:hypothetical protein